MDSPTLSEFQGLLDFEALKIEAQEVISGIGVLVKRFGLEG